MDFEGLRTFLAIQHEGGFSAAAEALGRSQPAISRRIALLEASVGAPLFERVGGRVALSDAGRELTPHAERALAALDDARQAVAALRGDVAGKVSLAVVGTLAGSNLTPVLRAFAAEHPKAALTIRTATSAEVSDLVRRGEATIGLRYLSDADRDLTYVALAAERMVVVCSPQHPLAGRRLGAIIDLVAETWLAFPSAYQKRETSADNIFSHFLAAGISRIAWSAVDSLTAQKRLVEAGFGLALMSVGAIQEELRDGAIATIDVDGLTAANPVFMITRRGGYLTPASRRLMAILTATAGLAEPLGREGAE